MKSLKNRILDVLQEFRAKSYFKQVLFSYIVVSCFTFLIFSVLLLSVIQNQNYESLSEINTQNVAQARAFNNSTLADIANYGYNMLENATVRKLLYNDPLELSTSIIARDTYDSISFINSMITSLDFINFCTETVLTRSQRLSLEQYYDQDLLDYISNMVPNRRPVYFQPRETYVNGSHQTASRVLSIIYYQNRNGALVINLDYDSYISQINISHNNDTMEMILLNQNNMVMAATNPDLFMQDYTEEAVFTAICNQPSAAGNFVYDDDLGSHDICYYRDTKMGITYISVLHNTNAYLHSALFGMTFRYSVIYILVTLLLSLIFSWLTYRPVKKLKSTVGSKNLVENSMVTGDDFAFLESAFKNLVVKNSALSKAHQSYEDQQMQRRLHALLEQTDSNAYISNDELEALDSCFTYKKYLIFIVDMNMTDSAETLDMDIPLIKFIISNVITEIFEPVAEITNIETISTRSVFIANFEQFEQSAFRSITEKARLFFLSIGLFKISFGFGSITDDLDSLSSSYGNAQLALNNGLLFAPDCIQFYDDLQLLSPSEQRYPYDIDLGIINALKNNSQETLDTELDNFFETIRLFSYDQIYRSIHQLNASLLRFEYINNLSSAAENQDWNIVSQKNFEQLKEELRTRCHDDIRYLLEVKLHSSSKDELIVQVQKIVEENIYNPNLSVVIVAEQVDLSVNYLRTLYKENTGESLSSYITNIKLSIICDLLSNTDTPIQDISDKLGFATKNYFFTFFKKHMNMTPNQYRSQSVR